MNDRQSQFLIMTSPRTLSTEAPTPLILSGVH
jgi:hypothetical protein